MEAIKKHRLEIRLSLKEKEKIKNLANKYGLSVSDYIRIRSLNKKITKKIKELNKA